LLKLRSAVLRTAVIGKLSLEWLQAPFLWASAGIFSGGKRRHFAYTFQVSDDAVQTDVYKALYPLYTKRNCSFYGNIHKKFASLAAIARYIAISYKIDYVQIFLAGYFFTKKQIAIVFNKTTIMSLFYLTTLGSNT